MKKFTFIAEYKGGTYISQYVASDLSSSLFAWVAGLDGKIFSPSKKNRILQELQTENNFPVEILGIDRVWCYYFLSKKSALLLNIVETVIG